MALNMLLQQVQDAILHHANQQNQQPGPFDPTALLSHVSDLFGQHQAQYGGYGNVRPASEDPYGDPADQQFRNIRPASEDPYGDPADTGR